MKAGKSISTGFGDRGRTKLFSGEEVPKDAPRCRACGDVDELVSALGLVRCHVSCEEMKAVLLRIQRDLFVVGAELSTTQDHIDKLERRVDRQMVDWLVKQSETLEASTSMPDDFVVPGGNVSAAHLDHARSIARRCERSIVALSHPAGVANEHLLMWMNRLSDYLWLLARDEEDRSTPVKE